MLIVNGSALPQDGVGFFFHLIIDIQAEAVAKINDGFTFPISDVHVAFIPAAKFFHGGNQ